MSRALASVTSQETRETQHEDVSSDVVLDKIIRQLVRENRMQPKPDKFEHCQKKIWQRRRLTRDHR